MNYIFAGADTVQIAEKAGLPLHLFDAKRIVQNVRAFQQVFIDLDLKGEVCFASKACGFKEILTVVAKTGAGADVASEYEMKTALEAGLRPDKMVIHGNAKNNDYLKQAVHLEALIVANDADELELIEAEAKKQKTRSRVLLRLSGFDLDPVTAAGIFTAGRWCKFGEPIQNAGPLLQTLKHRSHLDLLGFHVHIGSQITDVKPYRRVAEKLVALAQCYQEIFQRPVQVLNFGGGFPISYVNKQIWTDLITSLKKQIRSQGKRVAAWDGLDGGFKRDPQTGHWDLSHWSGEKFYAAEEKEKMLFKLLKGNINVVGRTVSFSKALQQIGNPKLIIEPGRAIVGDAGITLARVAGVRTVVQGESLVTLDLGIVNHGTGLVEPDLFPWMLANDCQRRDNRPFKAFVAGRLCFSGDMLSRYPVSFPRKPQRGDVAVIGKTGAYASTFFASRANGFPVPQCILVSDKGKVEKIK
jgi:diaminopimelate decarboxylase